MEPQRLNLARRRQAWLYVVLLLFGARLAWAFVDIQVLSHSRYVVDAQRQQKKRIEIPPERGIIEDRNGVPLAVNREQYAIYLVPRHIVDVDHFVERFTEVVPFDEAVLRERVAEGGWYLRLVKGVTRETVKRLEEADIDGVGIESYQVRHYPYGDLADDLLGRVDVDNVGLEGVELFYDEALRGTPGFTVHQRDALGKEYPNFTYPVQASVDGQTVQLTIDLGLQEIVEDALDSAMERTRARKGSVVVVDPRTGEILAMANRSPEEDPANPRNYAVIDQFEPGSTFKLVTLAGLYEEGNTAPTDSLFCENGSWSWNGRTLRDVHPYGYLTVEQVIEESSNICAAKLAERLGEEDLYDFARRFGFGLPTGLDFPGEPRGLLEASRRVGGDDDRVGGHGIRGNGDLGPDGHGIRCDRQRRGTVAPLPGTEDRPSGRNSRLHRRAPARAAGSGHPDSVHDHRGARQGGRAGDRPERADRSAPGGRQDRHGAENGRARLREGTLHVDLRGVLPGRGSAVRGVRADRRTAGCVLRRGRRGTRISRGDGEHGPDLDDVRSAEPDGAGPLSRPGRVEGLR